MTTDITRSPQQTPGATETRRSLRTAPPGVRREPDNYPFAGRHPRGWFQVGWSADFPIGTAVPMHYFSRDLVGFRGEDGVLRVHDAHCPHLGAHLGYGGIVEGDCIRCPYHGWKFNPDGHNVDVPYAGTRNRGVRLRPWAVHEMADLCLVWHDPDGGAPQWDPPVIPELTSPDYYPPYPDMTARWDGLQLRAQYIVENTVDIAHQNWVHRSPSEHRLTEWEIHDRMCRSRQSINFGKGTTSTWLTPDGPVDAYLDVECWGIGFNVARFLGTDDSAHVSSHTPIDDHTIDERLTLLAKREPGHDTPSPAAVKRFEFEKRHFELDVRIWENLTYVDRPPYAPSEGRVWREFREWAATFYE